ncbi:DNA-binding transcriptional MerR regulator OS=Streptomyces griseomycini OX=66895 GN=FHS37_005920 PE=4 SV=1 [Streptomyces griseomycini]
MRSLSAHMQPLVVQALLTTFQRSLREELREWMDDDARGSRDDARG